ncbi:ATP-grasp domain-containing protein [Hyphomicrobium facile]|uniref:Predicted ATP-dependent carboligase, ATP-grasp superfamily n=1 Tax=Hyphomicrobium facile TaxID=51670 RepID=A0A1I7NVZ4_9HYPH|nr:ATP-grasp domain-containing protein [Hyphomicrobium facile]SFV38841.1 Predicted ATP-dependent carboligase, ATP-grasp superfamily [Hyphomicrobium facile]
MSGETVLIAAFSGRSLAQSARRAGYRPLVADAFGDLDTQVAAEDFRVLDGAMQTGFRTKPIIAALTELSQSARSAPIGLVLGSGFEDKPRLVAALASRFKLLGSGASTYKVCKDPQSFFGVLDRLGIPHPETRTSPPADPGGWISKRVGGSGGRHIRACHGPQAAKPRRYFQKLLDGERISAGAVFTPQGSAVSLTRQWISPSDEHPFRFGGCVSMPDLDERLSEEISRAVRTVAADIGLHGMASFDFLVPSAPGANQERANENSRTPHLLEINPRPGASLDVLDSDDGQLFADHIAAWTAGTPTARDPGPAKSAKAAAILHADRWSIILNDIPWPDWAADRGPPGTFIPLGAPLATALAEAPTADAAEALARARLAELEDLIYGHAKS